MTKTNHFSIVSSLLLITILACGRAASDPASDTQATVEAAIAATSAAQVEAQATIDTAVQATNMAQAESQDEAGAVEAAIQATSAAQATIDAAVQATSAAAATPIPAEEYVTMTEEELAALLNEAVAAATLATEQSAAATTNVTADDTVSQEEIQTVEVYVAGADEAIAYAEELLSVYYSLYGDLAAETVDELQEIEDTLEEIAYNTAVISDSLAVIEDTLEEGLELAEETIDELEAAAQTASAKADELQAQTQVWTTDHQTEQDNRVATAVAVPPIQIAADGQGAIQNATDFFNAGQQALADGQISAAELADIAQKGANAGASLEATGISQFQELSGRIDEITGQFARGNVSEARAGLDRFSESLASASAIELPNLSENKPSLPDIEQPALPDRGQPSSPDRDRSARP